MKTTLTAFFATIALCLGSASAQSVIKDADVGYLYPAGGQQGTTFYVIAGGQYLRGASGAYVTGDGVSAVVIRNMGRRRPINGEERIELRRRIAEVRSGGPLPDYAAIDKGRKTPAQQAAQAAKPTPGTNPTPGTKPGDKPGRDGKERDGRSLFGKERAPLPSHPLLSNLEKLTPWELDYIEREFFRPRPEQQNNQIGETILLEVTIAADAAPGDRELRLRSALGLSNPLCFQVGTAPEILEEEVPEKPRAPRVETVNDPVDLPVLLNGQIRPGDVDRFRIRARRGQQLVIATSARHLIPYLADAVPGWFQATLTLFDATGRELAYADDFRFNPDPVLVYSIPETGIYELEVRDSIYRGREDFVYRIALGEDPFVKSFFPLGGATGKKTTARIDGWNLPTKKIALDTSPGNSPLRRTALAWEGSTSNTLSYAVDTLPECLEKEPNDEAGGGQMIKLPRIVNGRIGKEGDEDRFRFRGKKGDEVVVEVQARRLDSPLDSLVRLFDEKGRVLAWNDDFQHKEGFLHRDMGIITHHADSYVHARLPRNGLYCVQISDTQRHGGSDYGYRVRIGAPRPDFAVHVTPSSVTARAGFAVPVTAHVLRRDGFDGPVRLRLKGAPAGYSLQGAVVPAGCDRVRMTLTAPRKAKRTPFALRIVGVAEIDGETIRRDAIPSDEVMQAFLYRHLLPAQELVVSVVANKFRFDPPRLTGKIPVRIPAGGTAEVAISMPLRDRFADRITFELNEPPKGLALEGSTISSGVLTLQLSADGEALREGFSDNVIVEAFTARNDSRGGGNKKKGNNLKISLGVLPAIPIEVVGR